MHFDWYYMLTISEFCIYTNLYIYSNQNVAREVHFLKTNKYKYTHHIKMILCSPTLLKHNVYKNNLTNNT